MPEDSPSLIGHILDVQGSVFLADLKEDEEGVTPTVTIGDEDLAVGRLGSYVRVQQGDLRILAIVARMTEREKLPPTPAHEEGALDSPLKSTKTHFNNFIKN